MSTTSFKLRVPATHPSLPGHFPDRPIVPGVLLLDLIVAALAPLRLVSISSAKFLKPVSPDESIDVQAARSEISAGAQRVHAVARRSGETVLDATFVFAESDA